MQPTSRTFTIDLRSLLRSWFNQGDTCSKFGGESIRQKATGRSSSDNNKSDAPEFKPQLDDTKDTATNHKVVDESQRPFSLEVPVKTA